MTRCKEFGPRPSWVHKGGIVVVPFKKGLGGSIELITDQDHANLQILRPHTLILGFLSHNLMNLCIVHEVILLNL